MTFARDDSWVWDFWTADDGDLFHLFYLHAPRSLGDPHLRHRHASIGHATSVDLVTWEDLGRVLAPGDPDGFDGSATWTGSVVRADDGLWRMYYTGSRFLHPTEHINIESIGVATSRDLRTWAQEPTPVVRADPRWYETLPDRTWHEEAWRDPWVFRADGRWHMYLTARAAPGASVPRGVRDFDLGVIGHATSADLIDWEVQPPLTAPGSGFAHLEVVQPFTLEGEEFVLFSCDDAHLAPERRRAGEQGGIWVARAQPGGFDIAGARLLTPQSRYAGRIVHDRARRPMLMAFDANASDGEFAGRIGDPLPLRLDVSGWPVIAAAGQPVS